MKHWDPKSLWDEVRKTFQEWGAEDEDDERSSDPSLLFHLSFTVPLVIAYLMLSRMQ